MLNREILETAMRHALEAARPFLGATAPNPPVGAAIIDQNGKLISVGAHEIAGEAHAEVVAFSKIPEGAQPYAIAVTLEPCNHHGRTPPCVDLISKSGVELVAYGVDDPNPGVTTGGAQKLRDHGIEIVKGVLHDECRELARGFLTRFEKNRPWVSVKQALDHKGSMIPPRGQKTFTSDESLKFSHQMRKRSDAIITGSGTVLTDSPLFTVRHVSDHRSKLRDLIVLDHRKRTPTKWMKQAEGNGFRVHTEFQNYEEALDFLQKEGALEVLVEAGPTLSNFILASGHWDEQICIHEGSPKDRIEIKRNPTLEVQTPLDVDLSPRGPLGPEPSGQN